MLFSEELAELELAALRRHLRIVDQAAGPFTTINGRNVLNFSSNDYLGLASSEAVCAAFIEGVSKFGAGSGSSRLICGTRRVHLDLEEHLATLKGADAALTFSSGFATAMGVLPALAGKGDVIILDKLSHACLVDAAKLSGAIIRVFPHNHIVRLAEHLQWARNTVGQKGRVFVVTESVFSMDGDVSPLAEIVRLKNEFGALLLLDEAHAFGVIGPQGRGLAAQLGIVDHVDLFFGTLSKAIGLSGGFVAASRSVIDLLISRARTFLYSTAPPPALSHAGLKALEVMTGTEGTRLREHLQMLRQLWADLQNNSFPPPAAIVPYIIGEEKESLRISASVLERGFLAPAIRYPTVARGKARLRLTFTALHQPDHIRALHQCLASEIFTI